MEKIPYKLVIHTDSYTGNFEREVIAYCLGKLDCEQEEIGYGKHYIKAFWNRYAHDEVDNLKEYEKYLSDKGKTIDEASDFIADMTELLKKLDENAFEEYEVEKEARKLAREKERYEKDILRLYDTYLLETYQEVDDWEQDTFYYIDSYYKNEKYNCDTIYIQFSKIPNKEIKDLIIDRIKEFFENDIYQIIESYSWVCQFGHGKTGDKKFKLIDLEFIDEDGNLIEKFV